jgi:hypothetical protein
VPYLRVCRQESFGWKHPVTTRKRTFIGNLPGFAAQGEGSPESLRLRATHFRKTFLAGCREMVICKEHDFLRNEAYVVGTPK